MAPADRPHAGWKRTIADQRVQIGRLLKDSPSLRQGVTDAIRDELADARMLALLDLAEFDEHPTADPESLVFSEVQMLGPWLPD